MSEDSSREEEEPMTQLPQNVRESAPTISQDNETLKIKQLYEYYEAFRQTDLPSTAQAEEFAAQRNLSEEELDGQRQAIRASQVRLGELLLNYPNTATTNAIERKANRKFFNSTTFQLERGRSLSGYNEQGHGAAFAISTAEAANVNQSISYRRKKRPFARSLNNKPSATAKNFTTSILSPDLVQNSPEEQANSDFSSQFFTPREKNFQIDLNLSSERKSHELAPLVHTQRCTLKSNDLFLNFESNRELETPEIDQNSPSKCSPRTAFSAHLKRSHISTHEQNKAKEASEKHLQRLRQNIIEGNYKNKIRGLRRQIIRQLAGSTASEQQFIDENDNNSEPEFTTNNNNANLQSNTLPLEVLEQQSSKNFFLDVPFKSYKKFKSEKMNSNYELEAILSPAEKNSLAVLLLRPKENLEQQENSARLPLSEEANTLKMNVVLNERANFFNPKHGNEKAAEIAKREKCKALNSFHLMANREARFHSYRQQMLLQQEQNGNGYVKPEELFSQQIKYSPIINLAMRSKLSIGAI